MDGPAAEIRHPFARPPDPGQATEVAPGILWLRLPMPMALDHVNVYALEDGDGWTIVDTGLDTPATREGWSAALAGPLAGRRVRRVLVTHHHVDHVGLAGWFVAGGAELLMPRTGWLMARMLALDVQERPTPEALALWRAAGMEAETLARRAAARPWNAADTTHPLPPGFTRLQEGARFEIGGRGWRVRMGDGHAPEHATLWSEDDPIVIAGDQVLPGITPHIGVYPNEPAADPLGEWLASCARLAAHARPDHLVLPGHKLPFTGLALRLGQMAQSHARALGRLRAHLGVPRVAVDCFAPLFRRPIDDALLGLALPETLAHLNHLLGRGAVARTRRADGAWLWHDVPGVQIADDTGAPIG